MRLFRPGFLLAVLAVAACGGGSPTVTPPPPPPPDPVVDHVVIDNGSFTMVVAETRQLQVRPVTAAGELVTAAVISYSSSTAGVASVSAGGLVTAVAPGVATITATSSGKTASITVTVTLTPVESISIELPRQVIKTNDTTRVIATVRDAHNNILSDRVINWQSGDSTVVIVGPTGIVFGLSPGGPVTITGSVEGKSASVTILVTPALVGSVQLLPDTAFTSPDSTVQLHIVVLDEFGGDVENPQVIWASTAAQIARVSSTGLVTGVQLGDAVILATVGGVTGQTLVHVSVPQVERFRISVDNSLQFPLSIMENGVSIGQAGAHTVSTFERPVTERARLGWSLIRPGGHGEPMADSLPEIMNPTGTISMTVTNVLADGRVYFTPVLRNFTGGKNPINFPVVELASPCRCYVSTEDATSRNYGYWRLLPASVLEIFGEHDNDLLGPKIVVPVLAGDVEPNTGIWRYNVVIVP